MAGPATSLFLDGKLLLKGFSSLQPGRNIHDVLRAGAAAGFPSLPLVTAGFGLILSRLTSKRSFALGAERGKCRFPDGLEE